MPLIRTARTEIASPEANRTTFEFTATTPALLYARAFFKVK
jgi:hypothetical protein